MNRNSLFTTLRAAVEPLGYSLETGDPSAATTIKSYPAAWLETPVAVAIEGLNEGSIAYRIVLHLLHRADRESVITPEKLWDTIEGDALTALHSLSIAPSVIGLDNIKLTPTAFQTSNHGELGIVASFTLRVEHCF